VIGKKIELMDKETYFEPGTIGKKSRQMLGKLNAMEMSSVDLKFDHKKAALLVLDVQKYFFSRDSHAFIPSANAIIPNILNLIKMFKFQDRPVYYTRHGNNSQNAGMMATWWRHLMDENSNFSTLIDEIKIGDDVIIQKERYDAFWKTPLSKLLQNDGIEQVVITGVMTHLCCETTARSAFIHDYQVFFTIDGTATYTEDLHMASLQTLSHGFAKTVLCDDIAFE
jgi:isochorismate hydrolase